MRISIPKATALLLPLLLFYGTGSSPCAAQDVSQDSIRVQFDTIDVLRERVKTTAAARTFSTHDINTSAGTMGDPMRVLVSSAETVTNSDIQAIPLLDGDAADEFLTLLDGYPISFPYRLLGIYSLFNTLTTNTIELVTSGYPVVYGGHAPAAIRVNSATDYSSRPSMQVDLSLPISSACVHVPISDTIQCSATVAVRASHVGLVAGLLPESDRKRIESFLPDLRDAQVFLTEMPSTNVYATQEFLISDEHGSLNNLNRAFDYSWQKGFAGALLLTSSSVLGEHHISWSHDHVTLSTTMPIEGYGTDGYGNGIFELDGEFTTLRLQNQFHYRWTPVFTLNAGAELTYEQSDVRFSTFSPWLNYKSPVQSSSTDAAAFADATWFMTEAISTTLGVRMTYFGFVRLAGFEPRWSFDAAIDRNIHLDLSAGEYLQAPSDFQILYGFLNFLALPDQTPRMMLMSEQRNNLNLERHFLVSAQLLTTMIENRQLYIGFDISGYVKQTNDFILPARYPNIFTPLDTLSFEPRQCFRAEKSGAGISSLIELPLLHLSLTASLFTHHSHIVDTRTDRDYRDVGDVPRLAKLLFQYFPAGWNINILFQYSTGMPTTDQYYLQSFNEDLYLHLWKEINTSRVPDYRRLDITVTKMWSGMHWNFDISAGVINVLGEKNISSYLYELSKQAVENVEKVPVTSTLPMMPMLNVKLGYVW